MDDNREYIDLVRRAQLGDSDSLDELTELVRARLRAYVYRILLHDDVAEDIYVEAIGFFVYYATYRFKWAMIHFVMFNTAYLVVFTLLFVRETVVKPIIKLTNLIMKPEKYNE